MVEKNNMIVIKSFYNYNTDETRIKVDAEFEKLSLIHQLDALQDTIFLLAAVYERKLNKLRFGAKDE